MSLSQIDEIGYIPVYTRTAINDCLHETFNFRTAPEITAKK